jgi:hypothetical protein
MVTRGSSRLVIDLVPSKRWASAFDVVRLYTKLYDIVPHCDGALVADRIDQDAMKIAVEYGIVIMPSEIAFMQIQEMFVDQESRTQKEIIRAQNESPRKTKRKRSSQKTSSFRR